MSCKDVRAFLSVSPGLLLPQKSLWMPLQISLPYSSPHITKPARFSPYILITVLYVCSRPAALLRFQTLKMKNTLLPLLLVFIVINLTGQTNPVITSWTQNTSVPPATNPSYPNLEINVQSVYYTNPAGTGRVYVSCSSVPGYTIGPWPNNPNTPTDQNWTGSFPLTPAEQTSTKTSTGLGAIGLWTNGVAVFNAKDGMRWNAATQTFVQGITNNGWNRNALYWEGISFDACKGHPAPGGAYHHHISPACLYDESNSTVHSPIIGFAWDGYPIYGTFGYANSNGTGGIKRIASSYVLSTASSRTNGPPVNATYPLGSMCEDYVYTPGAGDLDAYNGRFCVTPQYPNGTYCYFATVAAGGTPSYPFVLASQYYGVVTSTGTNQSIPGGATQYFQTTLPVELFGFTVRLEGSDAQLAWKVREESRLSHYSIERASDRFQFEAVGRVDAAGSATYGFTDEGLEKGTYYYRLQSVDLDGQSEYSHIVSVSLSGAKVFSVHNNPASDYFTIQHSDPSVERTFQLTNSSGQVVLKGALAQGVTMQSFDVQTLYEGVYWLTISDGREMDTAMVVISR